MLNLFIVLKGAISPKFSVPFKGFVESSSKLSFVKTGGLFRFYPHSLFNKFTSSFWKIKLHNGAKSILSALANSHVPLNSFKGLKHKSAFSLVEMLMALLVASLLLAALAPVMTKKLNENIGISVNGSVPAEKRKTHEIEFNSQDCLGGSNLKTDSDGSQYCEGEFIVPSGFNGRMKVTVIGAGGGGGVAPTAGYTEYTTAGSTTSFTVPAMVNKLEATLVSGGAGGGAGGQVRVNHTFVTSGNGNVTQNKWNILTVNNSGSLIDYNPPLILRGKYYLVTACGGGGGGGGSARGTVQSYGGGGGSGGYFVDHVSPTTAATSGLLSIAIGGGGGGGGADDQQGNNGHLWDGGGGGSGINAQTEGGAPGYGGGNGGSCEANTYGKGGVGGNYGSGNGQRWTSGLSIILGGAAGGGAGKGGNAFSNTVNPTREGLAGGGGGGGGDHQGGGGGGAPGGSGGGGGGQTVVKAYLGNAQMTAGGGGGGGGGAYMGGETEWHGGTGGGGGGGGGRGAGGGGNGGNATNAGSAGYGGNGGYAGVNTHGGEVITIFGSNYCNGGNGGNTFNTKGNDGKDGALRISYLSYGTGGSGGGSGRVYALYPLTVTANEVLTLKISKGGKGGTAGYISSSGSIVQPTGAECPSDGGTYMLRESTIILGQTVLCWNGGQPGRSDGIACGDSVHPYSSEGSHIFSTLGQVHPINGGMSGTNYPQGFFSTNGNPAGYPTGQANLNCDASSIAAETAGGRGGTVTTPFTGTCTAGGGGTSSSPTGKNASGYGCGGGGGYGLADGGAGSGGYARISWNKYWDSATNAYKYALAGTAGGGASGNIATYYVVVKSGERIKIRIGKGGDGARVENNVLINAKKGGNTGFGYGKTSIQVIAGGGGGGGSAAITGSAPNTVVTNGAGGSSSTVRIGAGSTINTVCNSALNSNCWIAGSNGSTGTSNAGGGGAVLVSNAKLLGSSNLANSAGRGGITGSSASGGNASGLGSGGGGAGILDIGTPSVSTSNTNTGGNGSNGKILLEWVE